MTKPIDFTQTEKHKPVAIGLPPTMLADVREHHYAFPLSFSRSVEVFIERVVSANNPRSIASQVTERVASNIRGIPHVNTSFWGHPAVWRQFVSACKKEGVHPRAILRSHVADLLVATLCVNPGKYETP